MSIQDEIADLEAKWAAGDPQLPAGFKAWGQQVVDLATHMKDYVDTRVLTDDDGWVSAGAGTTGAGVRLAVPAGASLIIVEFIGGRPGDAGAGFVQFRMRLNDQDSGSQYRYHSEMKFGDGTEDREATNANQGAIGKIGRLSSGPSSSTITLRRQGSSARWGWTFEGFAADGASAGAMVTSKGGGAHRGSLGDVTQIDLYTATSGDIDSDSRARVRYVE